MPRKPQLSNVVKTRDWMFTLFPHSGLSMMHPDNILGCFGQRGLHDSNEVYMANRVQLVVYQLERAPTTNRKHFQGYVRFRNVMSMIQIKKRLSSDYGVFQLVPVLSTPYKAYKYCQKYQTRVAGPWMSGVLPDDLRLEGSFSLNVDDQTQCTQLST